MIVTVLLIIYALSAWKNYTWFQIIYSKDGQYWNLDASAVDVFVTVFPIVNTFMALANAFESPYRYPKNTWDSNKFFNIKK